jgi:hypothetical protein
MPLTQGVEAKLVSDLSSIHGVWQILFVGKNKENCITQLILIQHPVQLISCLHNTISIIAIYHKDQPLCILEVVPPQWPNLFKDCHDINSIIQNALMNCLHQSAQTSTSHHYEPHDLSKDEVLTNIFQMSR